VTISEARSHPAPTPADVSEYTLFFIPDRIAPEVNDFFSSLDEPDEHFLLVPAMRVEQLSWRPDRIKRADVRALTGGDEGVWVAMTEPRQAARLREILRRPRPG